MQYYIIRYSSEIAEVGGYPQAKLIYHPGKDAFDIKPQYGLADIIAGIDLYGGAKATSFLHLVDIATYKGLCVKRDLIARLEELDLPPMTKHPVELAYKGKILEYVILLFERDYIDCVNFKESTFVEEGVLRHGATLAIQSLDDLIEQRKICREKRFDVAAQLIVINSEMVKDIDLVVFPRISIDLFGSSKFMEFCSKNALTGLKFKPAAISFS